MLFTNAKVERMFSRMNRVKKDWRTRLQQDTLDNFLRVAGGSSIDDLDPDTAMDKWFAGKVRKLTTGGHKYPSKRRKASDSL